MRNSMMICLMMALAMGATGLAGCGGEEETTCEDCSESADSEACVACYGRCYTPSYTDCLLTCSDYACESDCDDQRMACRAVCTLTDECRAVADCQRIYCE